ncbi:reticulophagy regulator 3-like [Ceratina calcarata]|uniref:Reticulophagy regulator 3-like n=1 Tax=Ceratina calcarata TaxID=156304 RepID=A0AAJ7NCE6_9HYME|nr:reticulophagy regulator 3-like [Ceratina calcarata]XP_017888302.1 reticulophagy regulator 3-like [Ceratina calcarata]XP_026673460.1 reticulophagy regulator 3-like [Ceratina calcarata]
MERLSRVACYFRWMRNATPPRDANKVAAAAAAAAAAEDDDERKTIQVERYRNVVGCNSEASRRLCGILESILLWENSVNSISVVIVFNILFWGIVVLEVRGFAAASSAALVIVLCYSTFEAQAEKEIKPSGISSAKVEQFEKIGRRIKLAVRSLKQLRKEQPGVFCTAVCSLSLGLWIIGRTMNGVLLAYTICMSILIGPGLLLKLSTGKMILHKDWDNEIEEFLPAVTEDNLQVLTRAGESGDQSPTPTSVLSDVQNEFFEEEELVGLKMPSHEDGSTDGVEVSELELSAEETDVDGIKFQSGHFEKGSSSEEEEVELDPVSRKLLTISHSDESGSEFEIIEDVDNFDDA